MRAATTAVKIANGTRIPLTFGTDLTFTLPAGTLSGRLESRAANGDLVVLVDSSGTTRRVKAAKILGVTGRAIVLPTTAPRSVELELHPSPELAEALRTVPEGPGYAKRVAKALHQPQATPRRRGKAPVRQEAAHALVLSATGAPLRRDGTPAAHPTHNYIWRCATCKRRTRVAVCTGRPEGSHAPVAAPAGYRVEDRIR